MLEQVCKIIQAVLEWWHKYPEELEEVEILPGVVPGTCYVNIKPDPGFFAYVTPEGIQTIFNMFGSPDWHHSPDPHRDDN